MNKTIRNVKVVKHVKKKNNNVVEIFNIYITHNALITEFKRYLLSYLANKTFHILCKLKIEVSNKRKKLCTFHFVKYLQ